MMFDQEGNGGTQEMPFKVNNPLKGLSPEKVDRQSGEFAQHLRRFSGREELLFKAGRVAQDPPGWDKANVKALLSEEEQVSLQRERTTGFWGQTKAFKFTVIAQCLSAVIQGWIQSTINGANLTWAKDLGLGDPAASRSALWKESITNAIVFLVAALTCAFSDPLQWKFVGRRAMLFMAAVISLAASIGAACAPSWAGFIVCRALMGVAMGMKGSVTPIYAAEISPCHLRGATIMNWQFCDALGIFLGFTANLIVSYATSSEAWRWQTASVGIPALLLIAIIWTCPESPRLLLRRGHMAEAFDAMSQLRPTPLQAARDLFYANAQLQRESDKLLGTVEENPVKADDWNPSQLTRYQDQVRDLWWWHRVTNLWKTPRMRRALFSAVVVMLSQQLCGFNVLAFYSSNFFSFNANTSITRTLPSVYWLSWGVGLANFLFTIPAFWLIDSWGRVALLILTYPGMFVFMLASCLTFVTAHDAVPKTAVSILVYFFTFFYSVGQGPVAFTYAAEVFPLVYRESGMGFAVAANFMGAALLTLFVPQAQFGGPASQDKNIGEFNQTQAKLLGAFVALEALAFVLIVVFVQETKTALPSQPEDLNHMSLEELNVIFEEPTSMVVRHRLQHVMPTRLRFIKWFLLGNEGNEKPRVQPIHRWPSRTQIPQVVRHADARSSGELVASEHIENKNSPSMVIPRKAVPGRHKAANLSAVNNDRNT